MTSADGPSEGRKLSVLFVCLGNICRSPMAGAVFQHVVNQRGLADRFDRIESGGTADYHIGELPDERTTATCKKYGVPIDSVAQQVVANHFNEFDYIIAMDEQNLANLKRIQPGNSRAELKMFSEYVGEHQRIADPYYGRGNSGFERTYEQILRYSDGLLATMGFPSAKS